MHGVNLDLLRANATHHPDGMAKDPHAHHRAELLDMERAARRQQWQHRFVWLRAFFGRQAAEPARICTGHPH
jgi:hypothetical protein